MTIATTKTTTMTTTTKMKTTDPTGARATWRSLAIATPVASAIFLASLAWASAVTPGGGEAATAVAAPAASTGQAPASAPGQSAAPKTHATSGASK